MKINNIAARGWPPRAKKTSHKIILYSSNILSRVYKGSRLFVLQDIALLPFFIAIITRER